MPRILPLLAALLLAATPATAQAPVPPEGALVLSVGLSDGATLIPVAVGVLPVLCEVAE